VAITKDLHINRPAGRSQIEQLHHLLRRKLPKIQKGVKPPEEVKTGSSEHGNLNGPATSETLIMPGANPYSTLDIFVFGKLMQICQTSVDIFVSVCVIFKLFR